MEPTNPQIESNNVIKEPKVELSNFVGETYDTYNEPIEDILSAMKIASKQFLENETIVSKLKDANLELEKKITETDHQKAVKAFIKRAFPQVHSDEDALQLITHLIAVDQLQPNGWFNQTTYGKPENKLDMLYAIIAMVRKDKSDA